MCSIGGWITPKPRGGIAAGGLIEMGLLRGDWSAGLWTREFFFRSLAVERVIRRAEKVRSTLGLTHTRFPTTGGLGKACAQPLRHGRAVAVHNGHLGMESAEKVAARFDVKLAANVDSALWPALAHKLGARCAIEIADAVRGVSGLAVWDGKTLGVMGSAFVWAPWEGGVIFASSEEQLPPELARDTRELTVGGCNDFMKTCPVRAFAKPSAARWIDRYTDWAEHRYPTAPREKRQRRGRAIEWELGGGD